jgi:hypothetical protein
MTKILIFVLSNLLGLLIVTACTSAASEPLVPAPTLLSTPQAAVEKKSLPTPMPSAQMAVYNDLRVAMMETEITSSYLTEYGSEREPPAGNSMIWIHILLKNMGQDEQNIPEPEHFSVLSGTTEFKATYGHRKDHADYLALTPTLIQGQEANAWLRFDIPIALGLEDLTFVFMPESSQVSFGFVSSDASWSDHPIYLWKCSP